MKTILILLLFASNAFASSTKDQLYQYPYWIRSECLKLTKSVDRKATYYNYEAALKCAKSSYDKIKQKETDDAKLKLLEEKTRYLRNRR